MTERIAAIRYRGMVYAAGVDSDHAAVARAMRAAGVAYSEGGERGYVVGKVFVPV